MFHHTSVALGGICFGVIHHATNLPLQLTTFVGRERELHEVRRLLSTTRLLTLTGAGGVGKTRLALEAAAGLVGAYPGGVWLVDLPAVVDPALVIRNLASALGLTEMPGRPLLDTLETFLAARQLLIILDNCEHVLAACSELADRVLRTCPQVRILATSRELLSVAGEIAWRVPSLGVSDPRAALGTDEIAASEAARLFIERARLVQPDFFLTDSNASHVAQICQRLDGIPLAIELAAARVRLLAPEQILGRLDDCFRLLIGGSRSAPPRQQTLRTTLDWSYDLLSSSGERTLFGRLSVFAGGFTLEAAEAASAGGSIAPADILDLLGGLVDKSLVTVDASDSSGSRFGLLQVVRQYASERLRDTGEVESVQRRHAAYFLELADLSAPHIWATREQERWLDRLERENDNFRAALRWSLGGGDIETGARIATRLVGLWYLRGYLAEGRKWLDRLFALGLPEQSILYGLALRGAGLLAYGQGEYAAARTITEHAVEVSLSLGDKRLIYFSLINLGICLIDLGDYTAARAACERALMLARELGQASYIAAGLNNLGLVALSSGDYATAVPLLDESLAISEAEGIRWAMAWTVGNLGFCAFHQGDIPTARMRFAQSLKLAGEVGDKRIIAERLEELAWVASVEDQFDRAGRLFGAASALREAIGAPMPPANRPAYERSVARARTGLGEDMLSARWQQGRTLTIECAVDVALGLDASALPTAPAESSTPLTRREREVAALVAQGLSNREIAETLVVSIRTAETHITHVLNKLGLRSRSQLAMWTVDRGLRVPTTRS